VSAAIPQRIPQLVALLRRKRGAAYAGLVVFCWGITLAPLLHSLHHGANHRHLADGSIELLDEADDLAEAGHYHANGSWHAGHDASRMPGLDGHPLRPRADLGTSSGPAQVPHGGVPLHGRGSLAHFGVALIGAPAVLLPLQETGAVAQTLPILQSIRISSELLASRSPRGPPA